MFGKFFKREKISWSKTIQKCYRTQMSVFGVSDGFAAISLQFLQNIIEATTMPNNSAVTLLLAKFLHWFYKVAHPPPPSLNDKKIKEKNIGRIKILQSRATILLIVSFYLGSRKCLPFWWFTLLSPQKCTRVSWNKGYSQFDVGV